METIIPLQVEGRTTIYVTDTSPIIGLPYGLKIPKGTMLENRNEKLLYNISGLFLVDYTLGDGYCEGSVTIEK